MGSWSSRVHITFLVLAMAAIGLAGCGSASSSSPSEGNGSSKQLVLYSAQGYDKAMAEAFQKKTGIQVKLLDDSTGNLLARIEAERNHPQWDVIWFDGSGSMESLDKQGLLMTGWTPGDLSNLTDIGQSMVPKDHAYFPASTSAAAAIAYNTKLVSPADVPKDWNDLLNPRFKNAIAMNDPNISGPTYPFVAGIMKEEGIPQGEKFFTDLKKNGLKVFDTNGNTLKALVSGSVKVAMFQDTAILAAKQKGNPIQIVYPKSGVTLLPACIAIDKQAPDAAAAKQFVEFVLSNEGQSVMLNPKNGGSDSYFQPIVKGVQPNPARPQSGIKWNNLDAKWAGDHESELKSWFHDHIVQ